MHKQDAQQTNTGAPLVNRPPPTLMEDAYHRLEEMIVTLKIEPGSVVSEAILSRELNIGTTPIREALQRLAREHLVQILPRRGGQTVPVTEWLQHPVTAGISLIGVDNGTFWGNMQAGISFWPDVSNGIVKSIVFGVAVSLIAVFEGGILEVRMHRDAEICRQRPRCCGPDHNEDFSTRESGIRRRKESAA